MAPASVTVLVDQFDSQGVINVRAALVDSGEPTLAWAIESYPFELGVEVVAESREVVGLGQGRSGSERLSVQAARALPAESPHVLRAPFDLWHVEVFHRYLDEVVKLGFDYSLDDSILGPVAVQTERALLQYGVRESLAIAVPPGTEALPVAVELLTPEQTSDGMVLEASLRGADAYVLDERGLQAVTPQTLTEPDGTPVTRCEVEVTVTPPPVDCEPVGCQEADVDCEPVACEPDVAHELVCRPPVAVGVDRVLVTALGTAAEDAEAPAAVSLVVSDEADRITIDPSAYPYTVEVEVDLSVELGGLEALDELTHRAAFTLDGPDGTGSVNLPFEVWELTLSTTPDLIAIVSVPRWGIELGYEREDRFAVLAPDRELVLVDEPTPFVFAVAPGTVMLPASAELESTDPEQALTVVDVQLQPGAWRVDAAGFEPVE